MCKIVQQGDWSGLADYKQVPMLSSKNKDAKVLDVKTATHNSQERKLVLIRGWKCIQNQKAQTGGQCRT